MLSWTSTNIRMARMPFLKIKLLCHPLPPPSKVASEAANPVGGVGYCGISKPYNLCSNVHKISGRFLNSIGVVCT